MGIAQFRFAFLTGKHKTSKMKNVFFIFPPVGANCVRPPVKNDACGRTQFAPTEFIHIVKQGCGSKRSFLSTPFCLFCVLFPYHRKQRLRHSFGLAQALFSIGRIVWVTLISPRRSLLSSAPALIFVATDLINPSPAPTAVCLAILAALVSKLLFFLLLL